MKDLNRQQKPKQYQPEEIGFFGIAINVAIWVLLMIVSGM